MSTKHEAQQLAAIKRRLELDNQGAAVAIKRLRARIEELERALQGCVNVAEGKRMAPGEGFMIIDQARALLNKKD